MNPDTGEIRTWSEIMPEELEDFFPIPEELSECALKMIRLRKELSKEKNRRKRKLSRESKRRNR